MVDCHRAPCPFTLCGRLPRSFPVVGVLLSRLPSYTPPGAACPTIFTLGPLALLYSHWGRLSCHTHAGATCLLTLEPLVLLYSRWTACSIILAPWLPALVRSPLGPPALYTRTEAASPLYSHWGRLPCYTHTGAACSVILVLGLPALLYSHCSIMGRLPCYPPL